MKLILNYLLKRRLFSNVLIGSNCLNAKTLKRSINITIEVLINIQWMVVDVDNNGLIQAKDALLINNYIVGKIVINSQEGF
tara:strand:- start:183 stop:425 length:243 start_codon:yes stop_codon:yes gene_type:complete